MPNYPDEKFIIQVAGVKDRTEAGMLIDCGVNYIGFPLKLSYHQEDISQEEAADIISEFPPSTKAVLITYLNEADEIITLSRKLRMSIIQLHSDISVKEVKKIKKIDPALTISKSLIVGESSQANLIRKMRDYSKWVDVFILDTYDQVTGAKGATGKTHDWNISRRVVEESEKPVILAGGLNPANVYQAIITVKPAGVDVHTGVEAADGRKDKELVRQFISEARKAFKTIQSGKR